MHSQYRATRIKTFGLLGPKDECGPNVVLHLDKTFLSKQNISYVQIKKVTRQKRPIEIQPKQQKLATVVKN